MICSIVLSLRLFDSFSKELGRVHVSVCSGDFQLSNCIFLTLRTGIVGSLVQEGVCRVLKGNRTTFVHSACTLVAPWKTNEIGHSLAQNAVTYRRLLTCLTSWFALVGWTRNSFNYEKLSEVSIMNNYVNKKIWSVCWYLIFLADHARDVPTTEWRYRWFSLLFFITLLRSGPIDGNPSYLHSQGFWHNWYLLHSRFLAFFICYALAPRCMSPMSFPSFCFHLFQESFSLEELNT